MAAIGSKSRLSPWLAIPFGLVLLFAAWLVHPLMGFSNENDRSVLGNLISRALSTPSTEVSIGAVEGALSSDATILNITIADRDGVWLKLDRARLIWRRIALLSGRLEVDRLEIGNLEILRRPLPPEEAVPGADDPLLPELPVELIVRDFKLQQLTLGEPLLGTAAQVTAAGEARLGDPAQGLNLKFDARRLDAPGAFTARLELVPQGEVLRLGLTVDEPEGGIAARALSIPGLPPVKLDLKGDGTLSAFAATLNFDAGPSIGAVGNANLSRGAAARVLALKLDSRIEGLFPDIVAPVFAGTTELAGNIQFPDAGGTRIDGVSITSQTARLSIGGTIAPDRMLDLKVNVAALPNTGNATRAGQVEIERLAFDASIKGPAVQPTIDAVLEARKAKLPKATVDRADATFTATPTAGLNVRETKISLAGQAKVIGLALKDAGLAQAIGNSLSADLRGTVDRFGVTDFSVLKLESPTVKASYIGKAGARLVDGAVSVAVPDLSVARRLSGLSLAGAIDATAQLGGAPRFGRVRADLKAQARRLSTGIAPADRLLAGQASLQGTLRTLPRGSYVLDKFEVRGGHVTALVSGDVKPDGTAVDARVTVADLRQVDPRLTGSAEATGKLSGPLDNLAANGQAQLKNASALGRSIPQLSLDVQAKNLLGALDVAADLNGTVGNERAKGTLKAARLPDGGWRVGQLDVAVGSVNIDGELALAASGLADGRLNVVARDLDDIAALMLTPLAGDINAGLVLNAVDGGQTVQLDARGNGLRVGDVRIEQLTAALKAIDLYRRPVIDGSATVARATIGGQELSAIRLTATGSPAASDVVLSAKAVGFDLDAKARVVPGDATRIEVTKLTARRGPRTLALSQPATVTLVGGGADIRDVAIAIDRGRVTAAGRVSPERLDATVTAQAVPLAAAEIVAPGLGLSGTLDADARLTGAPNDPRGTWRARLSRVSVPALRNAGVPPVDATATGELTGGRSRVDVRATAGKVASASINGSVPLGDGAIDVRAQGRVDLALANATLAPAGRRLLGASTIEATIGGTLAAPQVNGAATLANASFTDANLGLRVNRIGGRIVARGNQIVVERFTGNTENGGTLGLSGTVAIDPPGGFPGRLKISGNNAQLINDGTVNGQFNLDLSVTGPLTQRPTIGGTVLLQQAAVSVPEQLPSTLKPIPGTRQLNPTPQARARLALAAKARRGGGPPPFDAILNVAVNAPGRIYVSGRGINAELGGRVNITGLASSPVPNGSFELLRGRFDLGSQTLDFTRGRIVFSGTLSPELDFIAETQAGGVNARIAVSGPAGDPAFSFSSSPSLSSEEVISRILFGQPAGELSAFQALQLVQIASQFSGGGDSGLDRLRQSLGLSGSDLTAGGDKGVLGNLSRAIGNRVRINVRPGTTPDTTGIGVNVDVSRRIRVQGTIGATGNTSVGVGAEWEY